MLQYGPLKADGVLQPVSGKALPVLRGEVLRIVQEEGEQCVDVHDSLNFWMNTEWDSVGRYFTLKNTGRKGDYVDLLATIDTLSVAATCGSGDVGWTSNFSLKPIRVQVFGASDETLARVKEIDRQNTGFKGQRTPDEFKVNKIKANRELRRNPSYVPEFVNYPITNKSIQVPLSTDELAKTNQLVTAGLGKDAGEVIRIGVILWYMRNREPGRRYR